MKPFSSKSSASIIKSLIIQKHLAGKKNRTIFRELRECVNNMRIIQRTIKAHYESQPLKNIKKPAPRRTVRTPELIRKVKERLRRKPSQSARKLARNLQVSETSLRRVIREDLGMRAYHKTKIHGLTTAQKIKRYKRSGELLAWRDGDDIVFSDEKLFVLEQPFNHQNDRVYSVSIHNISPEDRNIERYQNASAVMVWGAICPRGKLKLVFIDRGVKINKEYYLNEVLIGTVHPEVKRLYGNDYYLFQQDGAPSHTANVVQRWCEENLCDFIAKDEWPPSSPDLNPLDFCIWGYMLARLDASKIHSIDSFKKRLLKIWDEIPQQVVQKACGDFFRRLRLVRKAKGDRFENYK